MHRQLIPCLWTRHSKCTSAKVRGSGADHKVTTSGRSQSLSAADWCDWSAEVGNIRQCQSMERLERQQAQLELDTLREALEEIKWPVRCEFPVEGDSNRILRTGQYSTNNSMHGCFLTHSVRLKKIKWTRLILSYNLKLTATACKFKRFLIAEVLKNARCSTALLEWAFSIRTCIFKHLGY